MVFGIPRGDDVERFEIADFSGEPARSRGFLYLQPGLYRFRITWKDGQQYESYVALRCDPTEVVEKSCYSFRFLSRLR